MIYRFLKQIIKVALFFFFKKIVVSGKENLLNNGPVIVVANHPNTLMDPLIIASFMKQHVGFLANAGIFTNPYLARILSYFHVIPVFRKKDIAPSKKPDNKQTFKKCHEYLNKKGTLLIFPEGSSYYELKLRDIKTGTARIALSYESLQNDENNLKILPIALDYSDAIQFRSMVSVTIGKPISIESYREMYLESETKGVLALTERIEKELENFIPNTSNKEQEQFLIKAHKFYTTIKYPKSSLYLNPKLSLISRKEISRSMNLLNENNHELYIDTQHKVHLFFKVLDVEDLTPGFFTDNFFKKNRYWVCFSYFLKFILLSPIYIVGLLTNYIPYILPSKIFEALKTDIEYKTSIQMIAGLFTFPLFYWLQIKLFRYYISDDFWYCLLLLIVFPLTGYIAMYYWTEIKRFRRVLHFYFFLNQTKKTKILKFRDDILENIKIAETYIE